MRPYETEKRRISNGGFSRSYTVVRKDGTVLIETTELKPITQYQMLIGEPLNGGVLQYVLILKNLQLL